MGSTVISLRPTPGPDPTTGPDSVGPDVAGSDLTSSSRVRALEQIAQRVQPVVRADEQLHPVDERLHAVLPWPGLRRGSLIEAKSRALGWLLISQAVQAGAWVAAVGVPSPGWAAAAEMGVELQRLAVVAAPPVELAGTVIGALVDAVELVLVDPSVHIRPHELRRISARVRERKGVLVAFGDVGSAWEGVDVRLGISGVTWHGLEQGHGALCGCVADIEATGRGAAFRPKRTSLWLQGSATRWADAPSTNDQETEAEVNTPLEEVAHVRQAASA